MEQFNFKDFEKVRIKATYDIEIGGRTITKGETIAMFDKIQIAGLKDVNAIVTAHGGFDDRDRVYWETQKEERLTFSQGVFSKEQLALLVNSRLVVNDLNTALDITTREELESDEEGKIVLAHSPKNSLYIYDFSTGNKITDYTISDKEITIRSSFLKVIVDYVYEYENWTSSFKLGRNLINGFVELEGRTKVKDDTTGNIVTGIIKIPRLKLMSNLSIRLGATATPMTGVFTGVATPVGSRGSTYITEFYLLSDDIDSDF